jgi:hypothetical protein
MNRWHFIAAATAVLLNGVAFAQDYGKPGGPVTVVIGYQPYYTQGPGTVSKIIAELALPTGVVTR